MRSKNIRLWGIKPKKVRRLNSLELEVWSLEYGYCRLQTSNSRQKKIPGFQPRIFSCLFVDIQLKYVPAKADIVQAADLRVTET
jgi:hypothetical protein